MATKTKAEQEIDRLNSIIANESQRALRDRRVHDAVVSSLQNQVSELREDRRRLTRAAESLARRCDQAENYGGEMAQQVTDRLS